jgi:hypothetical protein
MVGIFGLLKIMFVLFGLADTFHEVKSRRDRRKEVRYHCHCLLAKTNFFPWFTEEALI